MGYPGGPRPPSAMLTDLCQLTMAYTYWKSGITGTDGCFHLYFRGNPFDGGCTVARGLAQSECLGDCGCASSATPQTARRRPIAADCRHLVRLARSLWPERCRQDIPPQ